MSSPLAWLQQQLLLVEAMQQAALERFQQQLAASLLYSRYSQSESMPDQQELLRNVGCARMRAALLNQMQQQSRLTASTTAPGDAAPGSTGSASDAAISNPTNAYGLYDSAYGQDDTEYIEDYRDGSVASRSAYTNQAAAEAAAAAAAGAAAAAVDSSAAAVAATGGERGASRRLEADPDAALKGAEGVEEEQNESTSTSDAAAVASIVGADAGADALGGSVVAANALPGSRALDAGRGLPDPEEEIDLAYATYGDWRYDEDDWDTYAVEGDDEDEDFGYDEDDWDTFAVEGDDEDEDVGYDEYYEDYESDAENPYDYNGDYYAYDDDVYEELLSDMTYDGLSYDEDGEGDLMVYGRDGQLLPLTSAMLATLADADELDQEWADYLEWAYAADMLYLDYGDYDDYGPLYIQYFDDAYVDEFDLYDVDYGVYEYAYEYDYDSLPEGAALGMLARLASMVAWARMAGWAATAGPYERSSGTGAGAATVYFLPGGGDDGAAASVNLAAIFDARGRQVWPPRSSYGDADYAYLSYDSEPSGGFRLVNDFDLRWVRPDGSVNWGLVTLTVLTAGVAAMLVGALAAWVSLRRTVHCRWVYVPAHGAGCGGCGKGKGGGLCGKGKGGELDAPLMLRPEECAGAVSAAEYVPPAAVNDSVARALAK